MKLEFLKTEDLEAKSPKRAISTLFAYRARLLEAARDSEKLRKEIFGRRQEIADLFKAFGGERHVENARFFEGLETSEVLLENAPKKKEKPKASAESLYHAPGFYVLGPRLSFEQNKAIRMASKTGKKPGNQIPINLIQLFRLSNNERPIYISIPKNERLARQLEVLIQLRPELKERLRFASWNEEGKFKSEPCFSSDHEAANKINPDSLNALGEYISHTPRVGEVFKGVISTVGEYGLLIEVLPGIRGFLHSSEIPGFDEKPINQGDQLVVRIANFSSYRRDSIFLELVKEEGMEEVEFRFPESTNQLLLGS